MKFSCVPGLTKKNKNKTQSKYLHLRTNAPYNIPNHNIQFDLPIDQ